MFEIGPSLREARERRGLAYSQVEADTAIRSRYVRALEEEEFSILPGPTYTKGFLRTYADYLGMDGQLFVDEFNSRHHDPRRDFDQPIASRPRSRPQQRRQRRESHLVMIVLAAIVAVTSMIFLVALKRGPHTAPPIAPITSTQQHTQTTQTQTQTTGSSSTGTSTKTIPTSFTVTLVASAPSWVGITRSTKTVLSTHGTDLTAYTIDPSVDSTVKFVSRVPVKMQVGSPGNLTVSVNGKPAPLPKNLASGAYVRIDATGVSPA
jgi:cytoskeleton protein RodZ